MGAYSKLSRPIHVVDYDPNWPALFEAEKALILTVLKKTILIEHFGSTSVPGLAAKPIIDISIGVSDLEQGRQYLPALESLGYTYEPSLEAEIATRLFLWKGTALVHTHHISIEVPGTPVWLEHIVLRDYLRGDPNEARRYQELKRELASLCLTDTEAYLHGKTAFILSCLAKAKTQKHLKSLFQVNRATLQWGGGVARSG